MKRKAHNYTLEYKNWRFEIREVEEWSIYYVNIFYKDNRGSMYVHTGSKTADEAKKRVENFIKDELK